MRTLRLAILAALSLCAACGQKGPLVLPDRSVARPVVIRTRAGAPAAAAPAAPTAPSAERQPPADHRDDEPEPPKR